MVVRVVSALHAVALGGVGPVALEDRDQTHVVHAFHRVEVHVLGEDIGRVLVQGLELLGFHGQGALLVCDLDRDHDVGDRDA